MKKSELPTKKQCLKLLKEYRVPANIVRHSLTVAKLATFLAERLNQKGIVVDVNLVERACLLHDIARVCDFKEIDYTKLNQKVSEQDKAKWRQLRTKYKDVWHEDAAYDILKDKYAELAQVIKRHRYMAMLEEKNKPKSWEEKIIFYADMRVMHDKIVPLEKRLQDGHKRNVHLHGSEAQSKLNTAKVDPLIYELERQICRESGLKPSDITEELIDTNLN